MLKYLFLFILTLNFFNIQIFSQPSEYVQVEIFQDKTSYSSADTIKIILKADIRDGFHINSFTTNDPALIATSISLKTGDFKIAGVFFPEHKKYKFEFSDSEVNVYENEIYIGLSIVPLEELSNGNYNLDLSLNYQACDDKVCYPPKSINESIELAFNSKEEGKQVNSGLISRVDFTKPSSPGTSEENPALTENPRTETSPSDEDYIERLIQERGLAFALLVIFVGGLTLNLTPCVYPLIPITVSYFGAQASGNKAQKIMMGGFYALGMAVTYSTLGVFAALTGSLLGTALQNPFVIAFLALILAALGTSMFGLFEIRVPQKLAMAGNKNRAGLFGSLLMGLTVGFIAAPCIGPFVLSLLVYVSKMGSAFSGFLLFFVLSLGLGLPYIFLAASSSSISKLPRSGEWMEGVKIIFGLILFAMAINTLEPLLSAEVFSIVLPVYLILAGIYLIIISRKGASSIVFSKVKYSLAIFAVIAGTWMLKPSEGHQEVEWKIMTSYAQIENSISSDNKPVMIDFYADWCAQCKELDKYTYTDPEVVELSKSFNNIKVDLTQTDTEIVNNFDIKGLPVVIFLDPAGNEFKELRVTGFLNPEEFRNKLISLNKLTAQK